MTKKTDQVEFYSKVNLDKIVWPNAQIANKEWLESLVLNPNLLVKNVHTKIELLKINQLIIPISINESNCSDSYVTSIYSQYILYLIDEINQHKLFARGLISKLILFLGKLLKSNDINKVVFINNWLLSTNLYPQISRQQIKSIHQACVTKFPQHAICFRSINTYSTNQIKSNLENLGYIKVFSRLINFWDPQKFPQLSKSQKTHIKADQKLITKNKVQIRKLNPDNINQAQKLYRSLYLKKYSSHNPDFCNQLFRIFLNNPNIQLLEILKNDKLIGIIGILSCNKYLTCPIFGYDASQTRQPAYRIMSWLKTKRSIETGKIGHWSSGVTVFKRNRGAVQFPEYNMVYIKHLPNNKKFVWQLISVLANISVPIIKKIES